ncbi:MAG: 2-amino-4-hydroxy-6-hydroxymethyldihydropteridine diphosphokinase [Desulfobulbaceae bacterium]|uniref:2-amino-4-hydroxy-6-hydroxymethyldihydropteridine pyrophosphokinase n=1 Tax=Candidatus Desulfobia pelagia TaxID=2841692 RepID=A0A8J6NEW2_9BACT|nr:2-amino-4-hydroxy-6-hydroxymethyldihydropteridine diphosphokinase [Candidatus Desulfobia pelagia]
MALVYIGLGSNEGDSLKNLQDAWKRLGEVCGATLLGISSPYKSEPVGVDTRNWFINAVGAFETKIDPESLLEEMLAVEKEMGRDRTRGIDRSIDLDLLYYDDLEINKPQLVLPHPEIQNRMFVLSPLAEIAPDHMHPVLGQTTSGMRKNLLSDKTVIKISWGPQ